MTKTSDNKTNGRMEKSHGKNANNFDGIAKAMWQEIVLICTRIFVLVRFHSNAGKNIARKMVVAKSVTASLQRAQSNGFSLLFVRFFSMAPFVFNQNSIITRYALKYFRLFPLFLARFSRNTRMAKANANGFNDSARCAQFLLFDVVSFPFFMHANKSSTFIRAEQTKPESIHCPPSPSYFIFRVGDAPAIATLWSFCKLYTFASHEGKLSHCNNVLLCWWKSLFPTEYSG